MLALLPCGHRNRSFPGIVVLGLLRLEWLLTARGQTGVEIGWLRPRVTDKPAGDGLIVCGWGQGLTSVTMLTGPHMVMAVVLVVVVAVVVVERFTNRGGEVARNGLKSVKWKTECDFIGTVAECIVLMQKCKKKIPDRMLN